MLNKNLLVTAILSLGLTMTACAKTTTKADNNHPRPMPTQAQPTPADHHHDSMAHHHFDKLDLTDAQKAQLKTLEEQNKSKMDKIHADLKAQTENIQKQKQAGADTATLLKLYEQRQATEEQHHTLHKESQQQLLSILTPEQKLKLYEGHEKMKMHQNHPHQGHHHGQAPKKPESK